MIIKVFGIAQLLRVQDALFLLGYRFHDGSLEHIVDFSSRHNETSLFVNVQKGTFRIRKVNEHNRDGLIDEAVYEEKTGLIKILAARATDSPNYLQPFNSKGKIKPLKKVKEYIYQAENTSPGVYNHPNLLSTISGGFSPCIMDGRYIINLVGLPDKVKTLKIKGIYIKTLQVINGNRLEVFYYVPLTDFSFVSSPVLNENGKENNQIIYVAGDIDTSLSFLVGLYPDEFRNSIPESIEWMHGYIGGEYNSDTKRIMVRGHVLMLASESHAVAFRLSYEI